MNVGQWNRVLRDHFFNPGMADRQVFLSVTQELLDELAGAPNASGDLVAAVVEDSGSVKHRAPNDIAETHGWSRVVNEFECRRDSVDSGESSFAIGVKTKRS